MVKINAPLQAESSGNVLRLALPQYLCSHIWRVSYRQVELASPIPGTK